MAIKFLEEKERQETLLYIAVFGFIIALLILLTDFSLDLSVPRPDIEERETYRISELLETMRERHGIGAFRDFTVIPPYGQEAGRVNPFIPFAPGMEEFLLEEEVIDEEEIVEEAEEEIEEEI